MGDFSWYTGDKKRISDANFKQSLRVFLEITPPLISRGEIQKNNKEKKNKKFANKLAELNAQVETQKD